MWIKKCNKIQQNMYYNNKLINYNKTVFKNAAMVSTRLLSKT